jgi:hypothetical protein
MSSRIWLPESATEWIASASMEENPVRKKARNLVAAMPRFASSAAMTALVPPSVDMVAILGCDRPSDGGPGRRSEDVG